MTPDQVCELLCKLGPIAREQGIDALEVEGLKVRFRPRFDPPPPAKLAQDGPPAEKPVTFAGRTQEELGPILAGLRS